MATVRAVLLAGGSARISLIRYVPASRPRRTRPPSRTNPPPPVTSRAWSAAARARDSVCRLPISRKDVIDVSSQNR